MVDVPITTAVTAAAVAPLTAVAVAPPVEAAVVSVPDKIQQLLQQIQVNATIAQMPADNTAILNSILGPITVLLPQLATVEQQKLVQQLTTLLQNQRPLTLVVQPGNPPTQAFIFLPPSAGQPNSTQQTNINPALVQNQTTVVLPPRLPITVGSALPAIVLPGVPGTSIPLNPLPAGAPVQQSIQGFVPVPLVPNATAPSGLPTPLSPQLPPSSTTASAPLSVSATVLAPTLQPLPLQSVPATPLVPAPQNAAAQSTSLPNVPTAAPNNLLDTSTANTYSQNAAPQSALLASTPVATQASLSTAIITPPIVTTSGTASAPPLQAGQDVILHVDAVIPPPATSVTTAPINTSLALPTLPPLNPDQIVATVTGSGANGQAILQSDDAAFYVKQAVDAPTGTKLILTVEQAKAPALQTLTAPDATNITNLQTALNTIAQNNPQLAQQILNNHIPQPTAALSGALLFFMSAFKQSNIRTWLGSDAVDALTRAGKFELLERIAQDMESTGQAVRDPVVGEWHSYPVPLYNNGQFQMMNFYVHNDPNQQGNTGSIDAARKLHTRFVIDVRMSMLGPLQLDGFVQQKKLDVIIRSEHALPTGLHQELRQVYINAISSIDYTGSLNFQVGRKNWLMMQAASGHRAVVT